MKLHDWFFVDSSFVSYLSRQFKGARGARVWRNESSAETCSLAQGDAPHRLLASPELVVRSFGAVRFRSSRVSEDVRALLSSHSSSLSRCISDGDISP